jgi:hypothetical protein
MSNEHSGNEQQSVSDEFRRRIEERIGIYASGRGEIDLSRCRIDSRNIHWVIGRLRSIVGIDSLNIPIGASRDIDIESSAGAAPIAELHTLNISVNQVGDTGAAAISELPGLKTLELRGNGIGDTGAAALAASPHMASLHTLDIGYNQIGQSGAKALAASVYMGGLHTLVIGSNAISALLSVIFSTLAWMLDQLPLGGVQRPGSMRPWRSVGAA